MGAGPRKGPPMAAVGTDKVGDVRTVSAASAVYDATSQINSALAELAKLQALYAPGTSQYAQCETIDDRLHDALALLGQ